MCMCITLDNRRMRRRYVISILIANVGQTNNRNLTQRWSCPVKYWCRKPVVRSVPWTLRLSPKLNLCFFTVEIIVAELRYFQVHGLLAGDASQSAFSSSGLLDCAWYRCDRIQGVSLRSGSVRRRVVQWTTIRWGVLAAHRSSNDVVLTEIVLSAWVEWC